MNNQQYCKLRDKRNKLRNKFDSQNFTESNKAKKEIKEIDVKLQEFERDNMNFQYIYQTGTKLILHK
jgi:hypothetical protein